MAINFMNTDTREKCINYIVDEWKNLPNELTSSGEVFTKLWGVWIVLHDPIPRMRLELLMPESPIRKVWFFDQKRGTHERDPWEFVRFLRVNSDRPWWFLRKSIPEKIFGILHQIAFANFADLLPQTIFTFR